MGLQKFRADEAGETQADGATPYFSRWIGGPTLALIRDVSFPFRGVTLPRRTIYIQDHADTWFSIPAACTWRRRTITGFVTCEGGQWEFHAHTRQSWEGEIEDGS